MVKIPKDRLAERLEAERLDDPIPEYSRCDYRVCDYKGFYVICYTTRFENCPFYQPRYIEEFEV